MSMNIFCSGKFHVKNSAFTLAEVLITLGIIGVVAALTLPNLVADYKAKAAATKLKKIQSMVSQAVLLAEVQYGEFKDWGLEKDSSESAELLGKRLAPHLKLLDDCGTGVCEEYTTQWEMLNGRVEAGVTNFSLDFFYKLKLLDGTELFLRPAAVNFTFFVDLNGKKEPNVLGKDIFRTLLRGHNVIHDGFGADVNAVSGDSQDWQLCNPKIGQGWFCTTWVIYKENFDYLKCPDELTWGGQDRCKK